MSEHTPEPWGTDNRISGPRCAPSVWWPKDVNFVAVTHDNTGEYSHVVCIVASTTEPSEVLERDARRIVACVNACRGIETETLEVVEIGKRPFDIILRERDEARTDLADSRAKLDEMRALVGEMKSTLERVRDEMEASGGWDGDEDVFQSVVDALLKAEALR